MDRFELTLEDGTVMRMCLPCGVGEHNYCWDDPALCNACAVCLSVRPQPTPSGS